MMTSIVTSESLLAVDIGTTKTRAQLFDVIDGRYRFVGASSASTTLGPPFWDAGEGVRLAINQMAELTGRIFFNNDGTLITPSRLDNSGVDEFVITMSAGEPIKVVAVGLVDEVSVESVRHLAGTTYTNIVETLCLNDRRSEESRIDTIIKTRPDLIIMAGGIEGGASLSVKKLVEAVGLACYLLPKGYQPQILYAGNSQVADEVKRALQGIGGLHLAANLRPTWEVEQLEPAKKQLEEIFRKVRHRQSISIKEIDDWAKNQLMPTATGFERIIRFLSEIYDPGKGVLGIDIGASSTSIATAFSGKSTLGVYPQLGIGIDATAILRLSKIEEISRWLVEEVPADVIRDYVYTKATHPESLPMTSEELSIEQAIARQVMQIAVRQISRSFPGNAPYHDRKILPWFEPILAAGSVLTKAPKPSQCMLMLLDGLQPTGVSTILLDQNNLVASLGAAADVNPALVVQVLGSNTILNLGAVIAPVGNARTGAPILNVRITHEDGRYANREVKFGSVEILPLGYRETATIRLQPLHRFDVGMGPGRGGNLQVVGGTLGVVIDGRGRPLKLSADASQRRARMVKWLQSLED